MAKVESTIFSNISGKLGGLVFYHGKGNSILVRKFANPINPNTPDQFIIRNAMSGAAIAWEALSPAYRAGWDDYAANLGGIQSGRGRFSASFVYNTYGQIKFPGGTFIGPSVPPFLSGYLNIESIVPGVPAAPGTGVSFTVAHGEPLSMNALITYQGPFNETRNYFKGPFPSATLINEVIASPGPVSFDILGLVDGGVYFFKFSFCDLSVGDRMSTVKIVRAVAVTTSP